MIESIYLERHDCVPGWRPWFRRGRCCLLHSGCVAEIEASMRSCGHRHGHPIAGDGARRRPTACGDHCCSSGRVVTGSCRCVPPRRPPLRPVCRHGSRHCCPQLLCLELDGQPPWIPQLEGHVNEPSSHAAAARRWHGSPYTKSGVRSSTYILGLYCWSMYMEKNRQPLIHASFHSFALHYWRWHFPISLCCNKPAACIVNGFFI